MLTLPSKFQDELNKSVNTPSFLAILVEAEGVLSNEQTLQADWAARSADYQVDWSSQVGSVVISGSPSSGVIKPECLKANGWLYLYEDSTYGDNWDMGRHAWQSFKQVTASTKSLLTVRGFFRKNGGGTGIITCRLYAADKVTQIGTSVDGSVSSAAGETIIFDFTRPNTQNFFEKSIYRKLRF